METCSSFTGYAMGSGTQTADALFAGQTGPPTNYLMETTIHLLINQVTFNLLQGNGDNTNNSWRTIYKISIALL